MGGCCGRCKEKRYSQEGGKRRRGRRERREEEGEEEERRREEEGEEGRRTTGGALATEDSDGAVRTPLLTDAAREGAGSIWAQRNRPGGTPPVRQGPSERRAAARRPVDTSGLYRMKFCPAKERSQCAYCDRPDGDEYDYLYCLEMSVGVLEELMEHGWWRTGHVVFKPRFQVVCCPGYATRMQPTQFKLSKSHRRIIRRWNEFLANGDPRWDNRNRRKEEQGIVQERETVEENRVVEEEMLVRERELVQGDGGLESVAVGADESVGSPCVVIASETVTQDLLDDPASSLVRTAVSSAQTAGVREEGFHDRSEVKRESGDGLREAEQFDTTDGEGRREGELRSSRDGKKSSLSAVRRKKPVTPGKGADPSKPPCRKAKEVRAERRRQKMEAQGRNGRGGIPREVRRKTPPARPTLLELFEGLETATGKHKLETKLLCCNPRDPLLDTTMEAAYRLYDKFQEAVHPGKTRFNSVSDFEWGFFNSPIRKASGAPQGTYHMHYYLDDELFMISILDILPIYFVSIYFIYDPEVRFMQPGIFTCLKEIELFLRLKQTCPALTYFALGYYNHFSPKVSYKSQFGPQEVLCNETNVFVPLKAVLPKMMEQRYCRLVEDEAVPEKEGRAAPLDNLVLCSQFATARFGDTEEWMRVVFRAFLRALVAEAGSSVAHKFVIVI